MKTKLLWVGDAGVATGFAKITHNVLDNFNRDYWDIAVLGVNYFGEPHNYSYPIYPCRTPWHYDAFGSARLPQLIDDFEPDIVVLQTDPWNIPQYTQSTKEVVSVGVIPIDGKNCQGTDMNDLDHTIFWTQFAADESVKGGFLGPYSVVPLGVDLNIFKPEPRLDARKQLGLPDKLHDKFIIGNVNRNQLRKHLDITVAAFAKWVKDFTVDDAYLFMHTCPIGDKGYDLPQLAQYYGIADRLILFEPNMVDGIPEQNMRHVYGSLDLQVTTTQGEGWGLTTLEGMACGVPQIVPRWSALEEWAVAAYQISCPTEFVSPMGLNMIGGLPNVDSLVESFRYFYHSKSARQDFSDNSLKLAKEPWYRWEDIAKEYSLILHKALGYADKGEVAV